MLNQGSQRNVVTPMRSVYTIPTHNGDDLTSSAKSSTRPSNGHSTGGAVSFMGGLRQKRKKRGKPSLTWPTSRQKDRG